MDNLRNLKIACLVPTVFSPNYSKYKLWFMWSKNNACYPTQIFLAKGQIAMGSHWLSHCTVHRTFGGNLFCLVFCFRFCFLFFCGNETVVVFIIFIYFRVSIRGSIIKSVGMFPFPCFLVFYFAFQYYWQFTNMNTIRKYYSIVVVLSWWILSVVLV